MVRYIGGFPVNPVQPGLLSDALIYRPEYGGTGLLNDGADFANVRSNFAGGMLDGFQIDPVTGMPMTVSPSGVFRPGQGEMQQPGGGEEAPKGAFTIADLMDFQSALNKAGNSGIEESVFRSFESKGDGTFDVKRDPDGAGMLWNMFTGKNESGDVVPINEAVYQGGDLAGEKIDLNNEKNAIAAKLSLIDNRQ
ncbi:MAG TPA: hypothetical protein DCY55_07525 [Gammaproteobacteria bacterium]|nr:hypothetical protein [Gammaproteobacteria bacterium]